MSTHDQMAAYTLAHEGSELSGTYCTQSVLPQGILRFLLVTVHKACQQDLLHAVISVILWLLSCYYNYTAAHHYWWN